MCLCRERGQNSQWGLAGEVGVGLGGGTVTQGFQLFTKGALCFSFICSRVKFPAVKTDVLKGLRVDVFFLGAPV